MGKWMGEAQKRRHGVPRPVRRTGLCPTGGHMPGGADKMGLSASVAATDSAWPPQVLLALGVGYPRMPKTARMRTRVDNETDAQMPALVLSVGIWTASCVGTWHSRHLFRHQRLDFNCRRKGKANRT